MENKKTCNGKRKSKKISFGQKKKKMKVEQKETKKNSNSIPKIKKMKKFRKYFPFNSENNFKTINKLSFDL